MSDPVPRIGRRRELHANRFFTLAEEELHGAGIEAYPYYQLESRYDAVIVVPRLDDGRLILERIYRHPYRRYLWEFPAGGIEPGEDPLAAGERELREETGYRAGRLSLLDSFEAMPGLLRMAVYIVLAETCTWEGKPEREAMELMEVSILDLATARGFAAEKPASSFLVHGLKYL